MCPSASPRTHPLPHCHFQKADKNKPALKGAVGLAIYIRLIIFINTSPIPGIGERKGITLFKVTTFDTSSAALSLHQCNTQLRHLHFGN